MQFTKILRDSFIRSLSQTRRKIAAKLPILVVIPREKIEGEEEKLLIYSFSPAVETTCKTIMARAVMHAAERAKVNTEQVGFDKCLIQINASDKANLVETLTAILIDN